MNPKKLIAAALLGATVVAGPMAALASARDARPVCAGLEASQSTATCSAGVAGSVTISRNGTTLTVVSVQPAAGYAAKVDRRVGREVQVQFRKAGSPRLDFKAEVEDGVVETRLRSKR